MRLNKVVCGKFSQQSALEHQVRLKTIRYSSNKHDTYLATIEKEELPAFGTRIKCSFGSVP
jgi:hypothetical protein